MESTLAVPNLTFYVHYLKELVHDCVIILLDCECMDVRTVFRTVLHSFDVLKLRVSANIQCLASVV